MKYLLPLMIFLSQVSFAVVNGEKIDEKNHPEVGEIKIVFNTKSFENGAGTCTGSLIGPNVILTAAHCLTSTKGKKIGDGVVNLKNRIESVFFKNEQIAIKSVLIHSDYTDTSHPFERVNRDLALIVSTKKLSHKFFPLLRDAAQISNEQPIEFYGYGFFSHVQPEIKGALVMEEQKLKKEIKTEINSLLISEQIERLNNVSALISQSETINLRKGKNTLSVIDPLFYLIKGISFKEEHESQSRTKKYFDFPFDGKEASIQTGDSGGPAVINLNGIEHQFAVISSSGKETITFKNNFSKKLHNGDSYFVPLQTKYFDELMLALNETSN